MSHPARTVYLDNAATTAVAPEVIEEMLPYFSRYYGNPSALYELGQQARNAITDARERIAAHLGANPPDLYFTSCGTESINWALKETMFAYSQNGRHLITTSVEHHATTHSCDWLKKRGYEVTYLPVDQYGMVDPAQFEAAIRPDTVLASIIYGNNEIGTIQPLEQLIDVARRHGVLLHADAVQALGNLRIDVTKLDVDLLSASGHKFYAPKGVGFLYIKKGLRTRSFLDGGAQERKRRAGTENVPYIMGMAKALDLCMANFDERVTRETVLRDHLIKRVLAEVEHCRLNGHRSLRLPGNANFSFEFIEGESLLLSLEQRGIMASSGSACASGSLDPSHVLLAIGLPHEIAHGSLRLTLGRDTSRADIDYTVEALKEIVAHLRQMSPLYEDFVAGKKQLSARK
ncbi:MAG: cysteine desulfurase NifS [Coriobacteriales bacterium]|jgi:cysteine desulfurase|nr:cysteine desulfurase NifS [Coriobacteriales bacterium]